MSTSDRPADAWLSFGLAFIGGYGDAASFVLAKTFTGHVPAIWCLGRLPWRRRIGRLRSDISRPLSRS
jgi:hypothetical protein